MASGHTRTQDAALLLRIEATPGTFLDPGTTTNMVEAAGGLVSPDNPQVIQTNTFTASIITRRPEIGRVPIATPIEVPLKATTVATLVVAPEWIDWARISGLEPSPGAAASAIKSGGNTGTGTLGSLLFTLGAKVGIHLIRVTTAAANAGTFTHTDPDGNVVGTGTVGVAYSGGGLSFTIADGVTDFIVTDGFDITLTTDAAIASADVTAATTNAKGDTVMTFDGSVDTDLPTLAGAMIGRRIHLDTEGDGSNIEICHVVDYTVSGVNRIITIAERPTVTVDTASLITAPAALRLRLTDDPVSASVALYREKRLWKMNGGAAAAQLILASGARWTLNGQLFARPDGVNPTDGTVPDDTTDQDVIKPRWDTGRALLGGQEIALRDASVDIGAQVYRPDNPNEQGAQEAACISSMTPTIRLNPLVADPDTRNAFEDFRNNTTRHFVAATMLSAAAGARLIFVVPMFSFTNTPETDRDGFLAEDLAGQIDGSKRPVLCIC